MSDERFERFLDEVRKRFWRLPPVRMEVPDGPSGVPIYLPNSVYDAAESLVRELPDTEVVRLLLDAYAHNEKWDARIGDAFAAETASHPSMETVRMAVAACAGGTLWRMDERIKIEDRLRGELAEEQSPRVSRR